MASADKDHKVRGYPAPQAATGYPTGAANLFAVSPLSSYSSFYREPMPNRFHQPPPPPPPLSSFLCRFLTGAAIVRVFVGLISFISSLTLKPHYPSFRVDSATVSSLNYTGTEFTARFDVILVFRNPNHKLGVSYDSIDAQLWYGKDRGLASTHLPPFFQKTQSEARFPVQFSGINEYVDNRVSKGSWIGQFWGHIVGLD